MLGLSGGRCNNFRWVSPQRGTVQGNPRAAGAVVEFLAFEVVNRHILKADRLFYPYVAAAT